MSDQKHKFRVGDIAQLRSGGPRMTVDSEGKSDVSCVWFAEAELRSRKFSPASLVMCEPEKEKGKQPLMSTISDEAPFS